MKPWVLAPFAIQAFAIGIDEFYFHHRRGLPLWERVGHPLDTLSVAAALLIPAVASRTSSHIAAFAACALFSCAFVTKDEKVHLETCCWKEAWLHAVLFLVHPIAFLSALALWGSPVLRAQFLALLVFSAYQTLYWNFLWKPLRSTTLSTKR